MRRSWYRRFSPPPLVSLVVLGFTSGLHAGEVGRAPQLPYDLAKVRHAERFIGSAQAKALLGQQGFVVTEEQFRQIFEPYLPAHQNKMPVFITVDSAWHTYHVLLEEGVQQVELGQARLLQQFSQRLYQLAARKAPASEIARDLAAFAAVGWAIQDAACVERLPPEERSAVRAALSAMRSGGRALFFAFPLLKKQESSGNKAGGGESGDKQSAEELLRKARVLVEAAERE